MIVGSAAIQTDHMALIIPRGIFSTGHFGQANKCVIKTFDTNYLMQADEVMASILHLA
jgi:hypothetical protein